MASSIKERLSALEDAVARLTALIGEPSEGAPPARGAAAGPPRTFTVDDQAMAALAGKLDGFGNTLSATEKATLFGILAAAAVKIEESHGEEGVAFDRGIRVLSQGPLDRVNLGDALQSIGRVDDGVAASFGQEVADSVSVGGDVVCVHGDWSKDLGSMQLGQDVVRGRWSSAALNTSQIGRVGELGGFQTGPGH